jgi:predicted nucleotidyltransferase
MSHATNPASMNAPPGMPDASLDVLRSVLARHEGLRLAVLFGSLARGEASAVSDLDVAVAMDAPLDLARKMSLIEDLALAFGRPVDLVDLRSAGEPLLGQILRHGVRLLGSDGAYAELLYRHLVAEADFVPYQRRILAERRRAWIGK